MLDLLLGAPRRRAGDEFGGEGLWTSMQMSQGWGAPGQRFTQAGTVVNQDLALTYSACFCATRILCEPTATVPVCLMRRTADGGSEHAVEDPRYDLVRTSPNPEMGAFAFKEGRTMHQINYGNGFAEIQFEREGDPTSGVAALWPIHPVRVRPRLPQDVDRHGRPASEYKYVVRNDDGSEVGLKAHELLHFAGALTEDGLWGKSIVAYGRESIGMGLGMERHGATQFGSGNLPRAVLFLPGLKDSEARRTFRREWKQMHGSPDAGEIAILPPEAKLQEMTFSNEASQYLESRSFSVKEIARLYRVPVHMLSEMMGPAGYNTIEQLSLEFVLYCLMPWLVRQEEQLNLKLLSPGERQYLYFKFDTAELLRGDQKTRFEAYEVALRSGVMTLNMVYKKEGWPTIGPAGDMHCMPLELTTYERVHMGLPPPSAVKPGDPAGSAGGKGAAPAKPAGKKAESQTPQALLEIPDVRQAGDFDCGAAATQSVALYFGVDEGRQESDYVRELGTTEGDGTEPEAIIDWLNDHGLVTTSGQGMSLDDLKRFYAEGKPVIVPLQMYGDTPEYDQEEAANETGHYVIVQGLGLGLVFFQDPIGGRQMMAEADFDARWHDREKEGVIDDHFGIAVGKGFGGEEGEEAAEEAALPTAPAATAMPASEASLAAARTVLTQGLERAYVREANGAKKAAKKDLLGWLGEREAEHGAFLGQCLGPAFAMLESLGLALDLDGVAARLLKESTAELTVAADEPASKFAARLERWSERASGVADAIIKEGMGR